MKLRQPSRTRNGANSYRQDLEDESEDKELSDESSFLFLDG